MNMQEEISNNKIENQNKILKNAEEKTNIVIKKLLKKSIKNLKNK